MNRGTPPYVIFHETQEVIFFIESGMAYMGMSAFKDTLGIPNYKAMVTRVWEVRYKLNKQGKYFFKKVTATYQHEANQLFDVDLPNAIRCGSARPIK